MSRLRLVAACALAAAAAFPACGGGELDASNGAAPAGKAGAGAGAGAGGSSAAGKAGAAGASGQGGAGAGGASGAAGGVSMTAWLECQDSEQAWVRKAMPAVMGRRALGQAEVNVYVDLIASVDTLDGVMAGPKPAPGGPLKHSRRVALEAMRNHIDENGRAEYLLHFIDVYRDAMRVQRLEGGQNGGQANQGCYGAAKRPDDPGVAAYVRDTDPSMPGDGGIGFTMRDVILGALELDDVSPMYIGNLIAMLQLSYDGANADALKLELARRSDFGAWFDAVYLHRDGVCLTCHNDEASVTFSPDPTKNRFFPLPGHLDKALFDTSFGNAAKTLDGVPGAIEYDGIARAHAVLRYGGFADDKKATQRPWGWDAACGTAVPRDQIAPDVAQIDAKLGSLTGDKVTAWDVTDSLQRGFAKLRDHGLTKMMDGTVQDPDEAFAYMVATNIVELVWKEIVGTPLTIANYFPRNAASRDQLLTLVEGFVSSGFSNTKLLELVTGSAAFNVLAPDAGCGGAPYPMPEIYDPWQLANEDPALRGNSLGDGVAPASARTLLRSTYRAMSWPTEPPTFFESGTAESDFQGEIGIFLKNAEPGFRGFDFQARLSWEDRLATCKKPVSVTGADFVEQVLAGAQGAQVRDVVAALKDRLFGDARIDETTERPALEALLGASLDDDAGKAPDASVRRVCGVFVSSPQFLLGGVVPKDATDIPKLTPAAFGYTTTCQALADKGLSDGLVVTCTGSKLSVSK